MYVYVAMQNMGSYRLLLTHFSQRYPNIPMTNELLSKSTGDPSDLRFPERPADPIFAFDCMRVTFPDLLWAPAATALLAAAFPQEDEAAGEGEEGDDADAPSYVRSLCDACLQCQAEATAIAAAAGGGVQVCSTDAVAAAASAPRQMPLRCPHVDSADGNAQRKKMKLT
jgi:hypothetical protein